jgi:Kef-type K+ transport system membrane component KefB
MDRIGKALLYFFSLLSAGELLAEPTTRFALPTGLLVRTGLYSVFVAKFALFIAIFLGWVMLCGKLLNLTLRLPLVAGQIIAGIFLGPSVINLVGMPFFTGPLLIVDHATGFLYSFASIDLFIFFILLLSSAFTVPYLLWIAGYETDVRGILSTGHTAAVAGLFGALIPIVSVVATLYYLVAHEWFLTEIISMGVVFAATSVSIPVAMLFARNKMHLRSSKATLGAAIIDDICAVILLSLFFLCAQAGFFGPMQFTLVGHHDTSVLSSMRDMVVSFIVLFGVGSLFIPRFIRFLNYVGLPSFIVPAANVFMLLAFAFVELFGGLAGITGAYFAGLFHRVGDVRHRAEKVIAPFVNSILLPIFLGSIGLQVDLHVLSFNDWILVVILLFVAIVSKMLSCWLATASHNLFYGKSTYFWRPIDVYLFGSSMVARGEVGLVVATILYGSGTLSQYQYVLAVVVIVLTTISSAVMLSIGFNILDGREKNKDSLMRGVEVVIGPFKAIGTMQMFNIIIGQLKLLGIDRTSIHISEGRKVINLQDRQVRIMMKPGKAIVFKGDYNQVNLIILQVKKSILGDLEHFNATASKNDDESNDQLSITND